MIGPSLRARSLLCQTHLRREGKSLTETDADIPFSLSYAMFIGPLNYNNLFKTRRHWYLKEGANWYPRFSRPAVDVNYQIPQWGWFHYHVDQVEWLLHTVCSYVYLYSNPKWRKVDILLCHPVRFVQQEIEFNQFIHSFWCWHESAEPAAKLRFLVSNCVAYSEPVTGVPWIELMRCALGCTEKPVQTNPFPVRCECKLT